MKDHYAVLGLSRGAGDREVKRAFHKMAKELHPDKNDSHNANDKFREVKEAYEALKDRDARDSYHLDWDFDQRKKKFAQTSASYSSTSSSSGTKGQTRYKFYSTSSPFSDFRDGFKFKFNDSSDDEDLLGAYYKKRNRDKENKWNSKPKYKPFKDRKPNRNFRSSFNFGGVPLFSFNAFFNMDNLDAEFDSFFNDTGFGNYGRSGHRYGTSRASPDDFEARKPHKPSRQHHKKHKYNMYGYDSDLDDDMFDWTPKTKPGGPYVDQTDDYYSSGDEEEEDNKGTRKFECPNCAKKFTLHALSKHQAGCGHWSARFDIPTGTRGDWRQQREEMLRKVRTDKRASRTDTNKTPQSPTNDDIPSYKYNPNEERIHCQFCFRKFSPAAAVNHILLCADRASTHDAPVNKPPPSHTPSEKSKSKDRETSQSKADTEPESESRSRQARDSTTPYDNVRGRNFTRDSTTPDGQARGKSFTRDSTTPGGNVREKSFTRDSTTPGGQARGKSFSRDSTTPGGNVRGKSFTRDSTTPDSNAREGKVTRDNTTPESHMRGKKFTRDSTTPDSNARGGKVTRDNTTPDSQVRGKRYTKDSTTPDGNVRGRKFTRDSTTPDSQVRGKRYTKDSTTPDNYARGRRYTRTTESPSAGASAGARTRPEYNYYSTRYTGRMSSRH